MPPFLQQLTTEIPLIACSCDNTHHRRSTPVIWSEMFFLTQQSYTIFGPAGGRRLGSKFTTSSYRWKLTCRTHRALVVGRKNLLEVFKTHPLLQYRCSKHQQLLCQHVFNVLNMWGRGQVAARAAEIHLYFSRHCTCDKPNHIKW